MATSKNGTADVAPKAFALLRGIGTNAALRTAMVRAGYTAQEHATGWQLLDQAAARNVDLGAAPAAPLPAREDISAWRDATLPRLRAALLRLHPTDAAALLPESAGSAAEDEVRGFLDRLDAMERTGRNGNGRGSSVIDTLAKRGLTTAERSRVRGLLGAGRLQPDDGARRAGAAALSPVKDEAPETALAQWYADWSASAAAALGGVRGAKKLGIPSTTARTPQKRAPRTPKPAKEGGAPCPPTPKT